MTDPVPGNNTATDNNQIAPSADLSVSKRAIPSPYIAGQPFRYEIDVLNSGPSNVSGARVVDALPAPLAAFTWTCTPAGGAVCRPASGVGSIDILVDLPNLTSLSIVVQGTVPAGTTVPLENTVTVAPPATIYDPVPGNNKDTADASVKPQADLQITKAVSADPYVAGGPLAYTVVVLNAGPSDVVGAHVQDALPIPLRGFTWTCTNGAPGTCRDTAGSGDIDAFVDLPVNGTVTFTVTGTVPAGTTGALVNVATVSEPSTIHETDPGNNSARAVTGGTQVADISVTKSVIPATAVPGLALTYTARVTNGGPSDAPGVHVADALPTAHGAFTWTCVGENGGTCLVAAGTGDIDTFVNLPASGSAVFTITGIVPANAVLPVENTVTAQPTARSPIPMPATTPRRFPFPSRPSPTFRSPSRASRRRSSPANPCSTRSWCRTPGPARPSGRP